MGGGYGQVEGGLRVNPIDPIRHGLRKRVMERRLRRGLSSARSKEASKIRRNCLHSGYIGGDFGKGRREGM
jgi:hypothetical protein